MSDMDRILAINYYHRLKRFMIFIKQQNNYAYVESQNIYTGKNILSHF